MSADENNTWELVLAFDTDSPEFVRGFEAGKLWHRLQEPGEVEQLLHTENAEMIMRMAEATGRTFTGENVSDGWMTVTLR